MTKDSVSTKIWHDPVISGVIAGAFLIVLVPAVTYLTGLWPMIGRLASNAIIWFAEQTAVSNWLLSILTLSLGMIIIFIIIILGLFLTNDKASVSRESYKSYTSDEFYGLKWRWKYDRFDEIYGLCIFCKTCDYQIFAVDDTYRGRATFNCEDCGEKTYCKEGVYMDELENRVIRSIQKKLRSDSWVKPETVQ